MKKALILLTLLFSITAIAADNKYDDATYTNTIGFLQGGGGLIGIDHEQLISDRWGVSVGIGLLSYGAAIHYHTEPSLVSNSIALTLWNQGFSKSNSARYLGLVYVFRSKTSGWSGQLGMGSVLHVSQNIKSEFESSYGTTIPSVVALYSFGYMF